MNKNIVIFGAPRSGTNALRDVLVTSKVLITWDCDELNYVWKYGNYDYNLDDLNVYQANAIVSKYINKYFLKLINSSNGCSVVEKTCANCLRPDFVDEVLSEPIFIEIIRNPAEVIRSAAKRMQGEFEGNKLSYSLKKILHSPIQSYYPIFKDKFLTNKNVWGPKNNRILEYVNEDISILAAVQWSECIHSMNQYYSSSGKKNWLTIDYDDFVHNTGFVLDNIAAFLRQMRVNGNIHFDFNQIKRNSERVEQSQLNERLSSLPAELAEELIMRWNIATRRKLTIETASRNS